MSSEDTLEHSPARIAKLVGWKQELRFVNRNARAFAWVDTDGNFKAWVDEWNPYESDADALMALIEWGKTVSAGWWELRWYSVGEWYKAKVWSVPLDGWISNTETHNLTEAITTVLERWDETS